MKKLPNGNKKNLTDEEFYNRTNEIGRLKSLLDTTQYGNPVDLLITGIRGIGKSVLLKKIKKELNDNYLIIYIDCSQSESFQKHKMDVLTFMEHYYECILRECQKNNITTIKNQINKFIKTNDIKIKDIKNYEGLPLPLIENKTNIRKLNDFVFNLPNQIYEDNKDKIKGVIILLDEFQIIKELGDYKEGFLWLLRSYMQEQNYVSYIFSGSMSIYDKLIYDISGKEGVFGGRMITIQIEPFEKETTKNYLNEKIPELKFTKDGFERFYICTSGIPSYINIFANELPKNVELNEKNILEELDENIDIITSHLIRIWSTLKYNEQKIIISLIEKPLKRIEIAEKLGVSSGSLGIYLNRLQDLQLIQFINGAYSLSEPLLGRWLELEYENKGIYPYRII